MLAALLVSLACSLAVHAAPARPPDLKAVRKAVNKAVQKKRWQEARDLLKPLTRVEDAGLRTDAWLLAMDVEARAGDATGTRKAAMQALTSAGQVKPRARTRDVMRTARKAARPFPELVTLLARVDSAPALARRADAWPELPAPGAVLSPTADELRATLDALAEAGVAEPVPRLLRALAISMAVAGDRGALDQLGQAAAAEPGGAATSARNVKDEARIRVLLHRKNPGNGLDPLVRVLHDVDQGWAQSVGATPPHTRSPFSVAACADVDQHAGKDACRRAHVAARLPAVFVDYSREKRTAVLGDEAVARTQAEYGRLLDECALRTARADPSLGGINVELVWAVQPDGRADGLEFTPRRLRGSALEDCMKEALTVFRYPPYSSAERRVVAVGMRIQG